ncbi:MAG: excinuclease ABC subunit UvrC [Myxococcota bacterium]|jgi:excinuclease ABC subunit C|nr:excinuclease ABC subunit UvrC [Myxococcota bacterium]
MAEQPNRLEESAASLPTGPGVYLFKDAEGGVLYVGKAQNLRSRVRQYLIGGDGRFRIPALVERAADVNVLITENVKDALLLENELIKQYKPMFNVRLRDDKQYLALRLDPKEEWPRLRTVRKFRRDGAEYFGPYTSSIELKTSLGDLRRIFPLRSCTDAVLRDYRRRGRPCIEYEMKRCAAPCCDRIDEAGYAELVDGTLLFLRGRSAELVDTLEDRMRKASDEERYEEAARLRDRIAAVERTIERQRIIVEKPVDRDVFGLAQEGDDAEVQVLHVREGRVVGAEGFDFSDVRLDSGEIMSSFLGQYYGEEFGRRIPAEVLTPVVIEDESALLDLLCERAERPVSLKTPKRGDLKKLVDMARENADLSLERRLRARTSIDGALEEIRDRCDLKEFPRRIECYDVSNLQGTLAVASRVVFESGVPVKNDYRRYRIQRAQAGDDYDCLREVLERRVAKLDKEPLPDLLMVDGGRGQLGVLTAVLGDVGVELDTLGLSKEREGVGPRARVRRGGGLKAERIFRPGRANPIMLHPGSRGLLLLQRVRDESHRFAIEFQRKLRQKVNFTSILEELPGIGPVKRKALLKTMGSLKRIREASAEELAAIEGISPKDAEGIAGFFATLMAADFDDVNGAEATGGAPPETDPETDPETAPEAPDVQSEGEDPPDL